MKACKEKEGRTKKIVINVQSKKPSRQGVRDIVYMDERRKKNRELFIPIRDKLYEMLNNHKAKCALIKDLGFHISLKIGVAFDRLAKRTLDGAICWFCENWENAEPIINESIKELLKEKNKSTQKKESKPVDSTKETPQQNVNIYNILKFDPFMDNQEWEL